MLLLERGRGWGTSAIEKELITIVMVRCAMLLWNNSGVVTG